MPSVGETLRRATLDAVRALGAEDRILLALRLGDSDVELAVAASGGEPDAVRAQLAGRRHAGRRPSRCASER